MTPNYCLPIIRDQKTEVLDAIQGNLSDYRYFEVWLDYVTDVDEAFIKQLVELAGNKLIMTFRRQNLDAPVIDQPARQKLLESLANTPVLVDLDITTQQADLDYATKSGLALSLITSYHNYQQTPDTLQLGKIIDTMKAYQPAVYKLSTLCQTAEDAIRLLQQLLELKASGLSAIVSGMGDYGAATRIFGTLWGNEMVFAPLTEEGRSAPGQLTKQQLETIFKELG